MYYDSWGDSSEESPSWIKIPQPRNVGSNTQTDLDQGRHFRSDTIYRISETLGAINTVGRYIVNMTRGVETNSDLSEEVPSALYTISKNVLGRNVTDTIAPLVREALPNVIPPTPTVKVQEEIPNERGCTTPEGISG